MRPRGRDGDGGGGDSSSPAPLQRAPLSSLVVKPPPEGGAAVSTEDSAVAARRRGSASPRRRRELSPPDSRGRERRRSPPLAAARRRGSPPGLQPRYPRFHEERQGYGMHAGSISSPRQRRLESSNFDDAFCPRYAHGYKGGGRGDARFHDVSPHYLRGGRSYGRGYNAPGKDFIKIDGEYVHRNDPNLSPREGDWICQNPDCGNLNFARRTHCNNCNKFRYASEAYESSRSPRKSYFNSPLQGPLRIIGPPNDHVLPREMARFRSPPRGWGVDDLRGYAARSPPEHVGRFADPVQRDRMGLRGEHEFRDRVKFEWSATEDYNHRGRPHDGGLYLDRSGQSGSPRGNWDHALRDRSRSPIKNRSMKGSFAGRDRSDLAYADPYVGRGRPHNLDVGRGRGRGRGYKPGSDPYPGQG